MHIADANESTKDSLKVLVLPHKKVRGLSTPTTPFDGDGADGRPMRPEDLGDQMPLHAMLAREWETDAHFAPYSVQDGDAAAPEAAYRLRKEALAQIQALGGRVLMHSAVIDLDLQDLWSPKRKDLAWDDLPKDEAERLRARVFGSAPPYHYGYTTRRGFRFVHLLSLPIPAGAGFEERLATLHADYKARGLPVDQACKEWNRLYRCPRVTREDGLQTWKAATWFEDHPRWNDDEAYLIPTAEQIAGTTPLVTAAVVRSQTPRPEPFDAEAILYKLDAPLKDGKRPFTKLGGILERNLRQRGSEAYPYVFGMRVIPEGERHSKLVKIAGICCSEARQAGGDVETAYALVHQAAKNLGHDEDWEGKAWEMVTSFWARDEARPPAPAPAPAKVEAPKQRDSLGAETECAVATAPAPQLEDDKDEDEGGGPRAPDDEGELATDDNNRPFPTERNLRVVLRKLDVRIEFDDFAGQTTISARSTGGKWNGFGPFVTDEALSAIRVACAESFLFRMPRELFFDALIDYAHRCRRHPVREYLDGLRWDGVQRIDNWLTTYLGVEDEPFARAVGRLVLLAAVRRIRRPGCKFDELLLLEGPQGGFKSTALKVLAKNEDWFSDDLPLGVDSKIVLERTQGRWIIEAGELTGLGRRNDAELKSFLSRQVDSARMAYGRATKTCARSFVVIGTTNSEDYLRDATGNRRYWPVKCGTIKIDDLRRDVDQLWAEAAREERKGEPIRLGTSLYAAAAVQQEERRTTSEVEEKLRRAMSSITDKDFRVKRDDLWRAIGVHDDLTKQKALSNDMGAACTALGLRKHRLGEANVSYRYRSAKPNAKPSELPLWVWKESRLVSAEPQAPAPTVAPT